MKKPIILLSIIFVFLLLIIPTIQGTEHKSLESKIQDAKSCIIIGWVDDYNNIKTGKFNFTGIEIHIEFGKLPLFSIKSDFMYIVQPIYFDEKIHICNFIVAVILIFD